MVVTTSEKSDQSSNPTGKDRTIKVSEQNASGTISSVPEGGYGYVIVFAAFLSNAVVDGMDFSFGSLKDSIHEYSKREGKQEISPAALALMGSMLTGFTLLTGPLVSAVANKFGFRTVAVCGSLITSSAFIFVWYLNKTDLNIGLMIILYGVIGGIGFCFMFVPAQISVGFYFKKKRALAMGIAVCGSGVGTGGFPPLITLLSEKYEWYGTVLVLGLIVLSCGVLGLLYKPPKMSTPASVADCNTDTCETTGSKHDGVTSVAAAKTSDLPQLADNQNASGGNNRILDFSLLLSPVFMVFAISCLFATLGLMVPFVYIMNQAEYALSKEYVVIEKSTLSLLISIIGAANTACRIPVGYLADRPFINTVVFYNVAVTIMGMATVLVPFLNQYYHFVVYSCVFGACFACFVSLKSLVLVELLGIGKLTDAFGLILFFQGIASMASTPLAGFLVQLAGTEEDFSTAFYTAGTFLLLAALICYPLNKLRRWQDFKKTVLSILAHEIYIL